LAGISAGPPVGEAVEVLDDRRRLGEREVGVLVAQDGDAGHGPQSGELLPALRALDEARVEGQVELVQRDQRFWQYEANGCW
jgi:hypothetical protein